MGLGITFDNFELFSRGDKTNLDAGCYYVDMKRYCRLAGTRTHGLFTKKVYKPMKHGCNGWNYDLKVGDDGYVLGSRKVTKEHCDWKKGKDKWPNDDNWCKVYNLKTGKLTNDNP